MAFQKPPAQMPAIGDVPLVDLETGQINAAWYGYFRDLSSFATPILVVKVGVSPFVYKAVHAGSLLVKGGVVSSIGLIRARVSIPVTGVTSGFIPISQDDLVKITYTGLPQVWFIPNGNPS